MQLKKSNGLMRNFVKTLVAWMETLVKKGNAAGNVITTLIALVANFAMTTNVSVGTTVTVPVVNFAIIRLHGWGSAWMGVCIDGMDGVRDLLRPELLS